MENHQESVESLGVGDRIEVDLKQQRESRRCVTVMYKEELPEKIRILFILKGFYNVYLCL